MKIEYLHIRLQAVLVLLLKIFMKNNSSSVFNFKCMLFWQYSSENFFKKAKDLRIFEI